MNNNQEINEEYIRKLAKEYFNKSIKTELDSAIIYTYIKSLEERIDEAIEYIKTNTYSVYDKKTTIYEDVVLVDKLLKILKGEE